MLIKQQIAELATGNATLNADGLWTMTGDGYNTHQMAPAATGGPDMFGYTWNDSVALNWINASDGVATGIDSNVDTSGPISINFPFKFYENVYTQLFVSRNGFLAFNNDRLYESQSRIPSAGAPSDVIAPHWMPTHSVAGYVRYKAGGAAPNRWFVVEWNRVQSKWENNQSEFTYEVILHENGNIVFQYGTMTLGSGWLCQSSGIEDSLGMDGLAITDFCDLVAANHAVLITRPAPAARVNISPLNQGRFVRPGEVIDFQVPIRNIGEVGTDTFDLTPSSTWPVQLYNADTNHPLTDTDGDSLVDTGSVPQGSTTLVNVRIQVPPAVNVASNNFASLLVQSSLNPGASKTASLNATIPAPFAQSYIDSSDGALSLYLAQPGGSEVKKIATDSQSGYNLSVTEAPNGNLFNAWTSGRCLDDKCDKYLEEISYAVLNHSGGVVRSTSKLVDLGTAQFSTYDYSPVVASSPDGRTALIWIRQQFNTERKYNYNVYFAVLDVAGNLLYPAVNLTNNNIWGNYSDYGNPQFSSPRVAATGDNRFVMAWQRYSRESSGSLYDIYYAVRDSSNNVLREVTNFTNDTVATNQYFRSPSLNALNNNTVGLGWNQSVNGSGQIAYTILNSAGGVVNPPVLLNSFGSELDSAQLSSGHIALAWTSYINGIPQITFAVLNGSNYSLITGPTALNNPIAVTGNDYVSVTRDQAGHAVLTWMDYEWNQRHNLYYALINDDGSVLTPPMIFRSSQALYGITTSEEGSGNTSYATAPTTAQVDAYITAPARVSAPPQGSAFMPITFGNNGASQASSVTITMTLDPNLVYVSDTTGVVPTISGNTLTWNLPTDLAFMGSGKSTVQVTVPNAPFGTMYPVTVQIASAGPEGDTANNTTNFNIMIARQVFLSMLRR